MRTSIRRWLDAAIAVVTVSVILVSFVLHDRALSSAQEQSQRWELPEPDNGALAVR